MKNPYRNETKVVAITLMILGVGFLTAAKEAFSQSPPNLPGYTEALRGKTWNGTECCNWKFTFIHKSGPFFRATWRNPNGQQMSDDNITVNISGDNVEIIRAGGSSAGGCTYTGKIRIGFAGGDYSCNGRNAGTWSATIN